VIKIQRRQPIMAWLLSLTLIFIGYYLSEIRFLQLEWLTRSGCLIVLLGFWSSIGAIIAERVLVSKLNIQHRIVLSRAKIKLRKMNAPKDYIEKEIATIEDDFDDRIDVIKDNVRYQLGILEVSLLMTGTFIWGFGDLLFRISF
jgi:cell division protein FtsB